MSCWTLLIGRHEDARRVWRTWEWICSYVGCYAGSTRPVSKHPASASCVACQVRLRPWLGRSPPGRSNLTGTIGRKMTGGVCGSARAHRGQQEDRVVTVTRDEYRAPEAQKKRLSPHHTTCNGAEAPGGDSCREGMQQGRRGQDHERVAASETARAVHRKRRPTGAALGPGAACAVGIAVAIVAAEETLAEALAAARAEANSRGRELTFRRNW